MDNSLKKYRNYEKTETAIKDALVKLYNEKGSTKKITVKDLCEEANISKSTFYLHYVDIQNIFEVVGDKFVVTFKGILDELINSQKMDFLVYIKRIFGFIDEAEDLVKIGLNMESPVNYYIDGLKNHLEIAVANLPFINAPGVNKTQVLLEIKIVASGVIDVIIELLTQNKRDELEKCAPIISDFLTKWVKSLGYFG